MGGPIKSTISMKKLLTSIGIATVLATVSSAFANTLATPNAAYAGAGFGGGYAGGVRDGGFAFNLVTGSSAIQINSFSFVASSYDGVNNGYPSLVARIWYRSDATDFRNGATGTPPAGSGGFYDGTGWTLVLNSSVPAAPNNDQWDGVYPVWTLTTPITLPANSTSGFYYLLTSDGGNRQHAGGILLPAAGNVSDANLTITSGMMRGAQDEMSPVFFGQTWAGNTSLVDRYRPEMSVDYTVVAVPEPSSISLAIGGGFAVLMAIRRNIIKQQ